MASGKIEIGFGEANSSDSLNLNLNTRARWDVSNQSVVRFLGEAKIGVGSNMTVRGELVVGKGANIEGEWTMVPKHVGYIGESNLTS